MEVSQYETKDLDHLGIVAGMCNRIGLIERIDEQVPDTGRDVSVGQAVQAMVLNGLGFVGRPLYLTPEFFANKPVELLIGEGIRAEQLNEHSLGRALDHLYEQGVTELFAQVARHALAELGVKTRYLHLDSSSFALHGQYEFSPAEQAEMIEITHGYSRDQRPDLKQVVLSLICTHQGALPVWLEALSGNSADKSSFQQSVRAYIEQLQGEEETPYLVADSALYSAQTIAKVGEEVRWVTRVPATVSLVQELYQTIAADEMEPLLESHYRTLPLSSWYGGVKQRWLLVYSDDLYRQQAKGVRRQVANEQTAAEQALQRLGRREYPSLEQAQAAVETLVDEWTFHTAACTVERVPHYNRRGRPAAKQAPDSYTYRVVGEVRTDEATIALRLARKGKFVLATNQLDEAQVSDEALLALYKGQSTTVERGFRFLKDPLFFADSFFLKKPSRIMALLMVMGLCLLIYALAEHLLRRQLVQHEETVPDQKGRPTQHITLRRVFQVFEGIHLLIIHDADRIRRFITNLSDLHRKLLRLLGPPFQKCYSVPF